MGSVETMVLLFEKEKDVTLLIALYFASMIIIIGVGIADSYSDFKNKDSE